MTFNSAMLFSDNPARLVKFYQQLFGAEPAWEGGDFKAFRLGSVEIVIGPHGNVQGKNPAPERGMLNYQVAEDEFQSEVDRVKALGARMVKEPYHPGEEEEMWIATFSDPDDNYFQLVTPWG